MMALLAGCTGIAPAVSGVSQVKTSDDRLTLRLVGLPMWPSISGVPEARVSYCLILNLLLPSLVTILHTPFASAFPCSLSAT